MAGSRWPSAAAIRETSELREGAPERLPMGGGGYELVSHLGSGGMAEVFLARRRGMHAIKQTVVVKRLRNDVGGGSAMVQMFAWEAWICSRLCHPNIVRFCDFVTHRGRDHLVIEHIRGADVASIGRALHATGQRIPFKAVLEVGISAARALDHAHRLTDDDGRPIGLVHRDVSPQNILVSTMGEIKLIDFGVAKTTSAHVPRDTAPGLVKGKMGYIAPEHLRGQALDARGDLYALGVVLFEMVTGRRLFLRGADDDMLRQALEADVPSLSALRPECPPGLETLVRRALAQDPRDRFESAAAMEEALCGLIPILPDERDAPALADLAREVHTAFQVRGVEEPPRWSNPPSARPSDVRVPSREDLHPEEDTRPEGALQRARDGRDMERESMTDAAVTDAATPPPDLTDRLSGAHAQSAAEVEDLMDDRRTRSTAPPRLKGLAVPVMLAFVTGLIVAAALGALPMARGIRERSAGEPSMEP